MVHLLHISIEEDLPDAILNEGGRSGMCELTQDVFSCLLSKMLGESLISMQRPHRSRRGAEVRIGPMSESAVIPTRLANLNLATRNED